MTSVNMPDLPSIHEAMASGEGSRKDAAKKRRKASRKKTPEKLGESSLVSSLVTVEIPLLFGEGGLVKHRQDFVMNTRRQRQAFTDLYYGLTRPNAVLSDGREVTQWCHAFRWMFDSIPAGEEVTGDNGGVIYAKISAPLLQGFPCKHSRSVTCWFSTPAQQYMFKALFSALSSEDSPERMADGRKVSSWNDAGCWYLEQLTPASQDDAG